MKAKLTLLFFVISSLSQAAVYYIDPAGNDASGNGSASSPWKTLTYACSHVTTFGDIIHINPGTYALTAKVALSAGVSIEGEGTTSVITSSLAGSGSGAVAWTIQLNSSMGTNGNQHISNIKMDGLNLTAWGGIGINGRSNVKIFNCTFQNFSEVAVMFNGAASYISSAPSTFGTGNEFHDNIVTNCASYRPDSQYGSGNLMIGGQNGIMIYNNTITQTARATGLNGYCIKYYSEGYNKGIKIYNNILKTAASAGAHPQNSWGFVIEFWNSIGGNEIYNNQIQGCIDIVNTSKGTLSKGFDIYGNLIGWDNVLPLVNDGEVGLHFEGNASDIYIYDNHFNNLSMPMYFSSAAGNTNENISIYYNIVENVGTTNGSYKGWGIRAEGSGTYNNWNILNNVFSAYTGGSSSSMWGVAIPQCSGKVSTNITVRNNIIVNFDYAGVVCYPANLASIENNIFYGNGNSDDPRNTSVVTNLTNTNNIKKNPSFVSSTDFRLQSGSPAINAGIGVGLTKDYLGNSVDLMPDIGAYEYNSGNPVTPVPVYQSSVVENASPTLLIMTYSLSLSNVVPAASAFTVQVNSVNRTVSSVAIAGGKVQLTLATPVVYGDIVTVAYTMPANNQLQTAAGGVAVSITAKSVTNNLISNIPVYSGSVVENASPSVIVITFDLALASIVPASSAFNVQVNSVSRTVSAVSVNGTKVQLTLASSVAYADVITVSYTKPSTNPLQSASGGIVASISSKPVTNNCNPVAPVYVSSAIQNATPALLEMTYNLSLANIVPSTSAFSVRVNSVARTISSVAIVSGIVQLTLASAVVYGDIITVSYTAPSTKPLQTASGGLAASITSKPVTNYCNPVAPVYVSSVIQNATPSLLEITYNLSLANIVPSASAFSVKVNAVTRNISSVVVTGTKVQLTLVSAVVYGDVVTISYTPPSSNPLQTASGGLAAALSAKTVTNNCTSPVPVYVSSVIENATPAILEMTYSLTLANVAPAASSFVVRVNSVTRTVSTVTITSGKVRLTLSSPVVYGDVVTVAYSAPSNNPLQTASGSLAASLSAQPVTNNCVSPVPVYISSVVENATPALLELTYSITLANIVPSVSAFSVHVNSVTRSINSVAISGSKVQLILSAPVAFNDVITVTYSVPSNNPLQTSAGSLAAGLSNAPVTNNCTAPVPVYISSVIEDASPSILEMTYDLTMANIIPATSSFNVRVNSVSRSVTSVTINGTKVQLTLSGSVIYGDNVTVSYTKPSGNPLQGTSGGLAASISAKTVTNNCMPVIPVYVSSVIENATPALLEIKYNITLANIVPASSAFNVQVNSVSRVISSVSVTGSEVQLILSGAVAYGDIVTVSYSAPSTNKIQTVSGGAAVSFSAKTVTNNCLPVVPVFVSASIENTTPSMLEMDYDLSLANIIPANSAFTVRVNSVTRSISSVAVNGNVVRITLSVPVAFGDAVTVAYNRPSNNPLQTTSGGLAASLSAKPVTNNVLPIVPVYVSSVIQNATASLLEMTYSLSLSNVIPSSAAFSVKVNSASRAIISVSIVSGKVQLTLASPVVYGDVVTVAYSTPASNLLQTSSGGIAESLSPQPVTNNCISPTPVYVSSVIEDATATLLEMTYNISLASIVPVTTSFTVRVNGAGRTVNSVSVAGTKVQLTLASPVVYGDIVTISYTPPFRQPLQTTSGVLAESISNQPVINNCISPVPIYIGSVVENATPSVIGMTYNLSLINVVPATSAFMVQVNSAARSINSVAIVAGKVQLSLASPVVYGDIVTVSYTVPANNPLRSVTGGLATGISDKPVTNNCISPIPVYKSSVIENDTPDILEIVYNLNLANIVPSRNSFYVRVNSVSRTVNSVAIVDDEVLLTLSAPVVYGDIITVSYTRPYRNPIQTNEGMLAESVTNKSVSNNCISNVPVFISSVIENATPSILEMTYDLTLANILPDAASFNVLVNSKTRAVTTVEVSGWKVRLTLASPVVYGDVVVVSYTAPGLNPLQSVEGGTAGDISSKPVTNNCISIVPVYINSVIENSSPGILEMTYDLSLANIVPASDAFDVQVNSAARNVSSVSIVNGKVRLSLDSDVIFGDIVIVSYIPPDTNPLQTYTGGLAGIITDEPVNNKCISIIPIYVNSVIENDFPSIIEMNYNVSLADIIPETTSFNVLVNSVPVSVSSVAIVDDMVRLTIVNPVTFGDVVTIDYTVPDINPLQSLSGGLVSDMSGQQVINNCLSPTPVYVSSVVQNATPERLDISYNISLANIIPDTASFKVMVNSEYIVVNSIDIIDNIIRLTLASAVVYGDQVTVTYEAPDTNPIQTQSGGLAESIDAVPVTNNCKYIPEPDIPPFIIVKSDADTCYSGFVYELDASESYDLDNDILIYDWTPPFNVSVSSRKNSKIQFLAPVVRTSQYLEFILQVNDGKTITSKTITVNVRPYKPELYVSEITEIEVSDFQVPDYKNNVADDNLTTKWSANGDNEWLTFTLAKSFNISFLEIAFLPGQKYASYFDVYSSKDNLTWDLIISNASSCDFSGDIQMFDFPGSATDTSYTYVKIVGHGNSLNSWNNFSEIKIIGNSKKASEPVVPELLKIAFYPNPASDLVNISLTGSTINAFSFRVIDLSGSVIMEGPLFNGINSVYFPGNIRPGAYVMEFLLDKIILDTQKLIITR